MFVSSSLMDHKRRVSGCGETLLNLWAERDGPGNKKQDAILP